MKNRLVFTFTKDEKRGIFVLLVFVVILISVRIYIPYYVGKPVVKRYELAYLKEMETRIEQRKNNNKSIINKELIPKEEKRPILTVDPNTASYSDLIDIGFSQFIASNIIKYRESGGRFLQFSDLYKIYGIDSTYDELLSQYIHINQQNYRSHSTKTENKLHINICSAEVKELEYLPGIGVVLSERIVKYRDLLGGYVNINQIREVYGITDSTFKLIEPYIHVGSEPYRYLNLNVSTAKELYKHPYVTRYQARAIITYREVSGKFSSTDELISNHIMDKQTYDKIVKYLTIEE